MPGQLYMPFKKAFENSLLHTCIHKWYLCVNAGVLIHRVCVQSQRSTFRSRFSPSFPHLSVDRTQVSRLGWPALYPWEPSCQPCISSY